MVFYSAQTPVPDFTGECEEDCSWSKLPVLARRTSPTHVAQWKSNIRKGCATVRFRSWTVGMAYQWVRSVNWYKHHADNVKTGRFESSLTYFWRTFHAGLTARKVELLGVV